MSLINCPECNNQISEYANCCPKCGYPIKIDELTLQKLKKHISEHYYDSELDVSNFNTAGIMDMTNLFRGVWAKNIIGLENWDTSSVTNMDSMFCACVRLTNLDIGNWDTSSATYMVGMFCWCERLTNLDIGNWDTSSLTNMMGMFSGCERLPNSKKIIN